MDLRPAFPDSERLTARIAELIDAGRFGAARPLIAAVRRLTPASPRVAELAAVLALKQDRFDEARQEIDAALSSSPGQASLYKCRAEVRRRQGDLGGAAQDAAEAVVLDPGDAGAKAILGIALLALGRATDAAKCLVAAVAREPGNTDFREALADAQAACGQPQAAAETLEVGIAAAPGQTSLHNAAVLHALRRRNFAEAVRLAEAARQVGAVDACLFGLMGHALSSLGQHEAAAAAYADALKLGPDDPYVRHLVAASGALPGAQRAPTDYIRVVFDGYADRFERHLLSLGYRVPGLIRAALLAQVDLGRGERFGPVLDLGCGTGLVAVALLDLPIGPITGVDIAPRMLAAASAKGLYAELREADIVTVLAEPGPPWRAILAADVLCYFGALDDVLSAAHTRLAPDGLFVFSVEEQVRSHDGVARPEDWSLGWQGRFSHRLAYVERAAEAAGFVIRAIERQPLREEAGVLVAGLLAVLVRVA